MAANLPSSKHEEKTHDQFPGRYSSQTTIWVSHIYDNSRTHITAGTVSLTKPHAKSEVPALWS